MKNFDRELALERAGGDLDLARQMHAMLSREISIVEALIASARGEGDFEAMIEHVHKLHGATRYCGVPALEADCQELEKALRAKEHGELEKLLDRLFGTIADLSANPPVL